MEMCTFFLFCLNIIFVSFSTALQRLQKIVKCFPEDKKSQIYPDLEIQKVSPQIQLCFFLVCLAEPSIEQTKQALENKKDGKIKIKAHCQVF